MQCGDHFLNYKEKAILIAKVLVCLKYNEVVTSVS